MKQQIATGFLESAGGTCCCAMPFSTTNVLGKSLWGKINIVVGVALALVGLGFQAVFHASYHPMYKTLPYMLMFIVGALLAKHRTVLVQGIGQMNVLMIYVLYKECKLFF